MQQFLTFINTGEKLLFALILLTAVVFIQCNDTILNDNHPESNTVLSKGPGGGGHTETATNNLSVPTIMIKGSFTGVTLGENSLLFPSGEPLTGYEVEGYYYVQGVHKWQGEATSATFATATAEWGDNLAGDANLKVGSPIRVELGLFDDQGLEMQGFTVIKLEPSKLDRESKYGTLATYDDVNEKWNATAEILPARVYDSGVTFSVKNMSTGAYAVPEGTNPTAEINATGKVVYGYNLRVTDAAQYDIRFVIPNVDITGKDVGYLISSSTAPDTVGLIVTVTAGGGGGGRK